MNNIKQLKLVLLAVVVLSAGLIGVTMHRYQQLNAKVAEFNSRIQSVPSEEEAKAVVKDFLSETVSRTAAVSASAKKDEGSSTRICQGAETPEKDGCKDRKGSCSSSFFGLFCLTHYQESGSVGSGGVGVNSGGSFGGFSWGGSGQTWSTPSVGSGGGDSRPRIVPTGGGTTNASGSNSNSTGTTSSGAGVGTPWLDCSLPGSCGFRPPR